MNAGTRRWVIRSIGVGLVCALTGGGWLMHGALLVAVGHTAKTLCSGVFVSRLDPEAVLAALRTDDLAVLRHIDASIDPHAQSATASALGIVIRHAIYRDGLGCALALDGRTPPALLPVAVSPAAGQALLLHEGRAASLDAVVARAFSEPDSTRQRRTLAVVILQQDRILAEQYAPGIGAETPLPGWSMTKSVMNALVGVLVQEGRLTLDMPAPIPEWQQDARAAITLDHLLRMSSGLRFDEGMEGPWSDVMRMLFATGDMAAFAASKKLAVPPGARWQYASGTSNIMARVIRHAVLDQEQYLTFPRRMLFDRIGMTSAVLETDAAGTFAGSSYLYATARDWARFGLLYLQDGVRDGARLLPEGWVTYTTTPAPADSTRRYGAHFWLEVPEEYAGTDARLPVPAFHAAGHEAQFVTIVPSRDLVIVRLGRTRFPEAWNHAAFVREILGALERPTR